MKDYPLVVVRWRDSSTIGNGKWIDLDGADEFASMECQSVGWVVGENEDCMVLAPHLADTEQGCGLMAIPLECIVECHRVEVA